MRIAARPVGRRPTNVPPEPLGTEEEIAGLSLDLRLYGSCSRSRPGFPESGCPEYDVCGFHERGVSGPENFAYEITKDEKMGGGARQEAAPCFACLRAQKMIESQGGTFDILGGPGTPFVRGGTASLAETKIAAFRKEHPGEPVPRDLREALWNKEHPDFGIRIDVVTDHVVQPFVRPKDNPLLAAAAVRARIRADSIARRKQAAKDARLGIGADVFDEEGFLAEHDELEGVGVEGSGARARPRAHGAEGAGAAAEPRGLQAGAGPGAEDQEHLGGREGGRPHRGKRGSAPSAGDEGSVEEGREGAE